MKSRVSIVGNRLLIERDFDAPRELIFDAWKRADKLQQWWGCGTTTNVESDIDFRAGGAFRHRMQIENCGECLYEGTFVEIIEMEKIVWRADFGGSTEQVTVEFIDQGDTTRLLLTQDGFPDPDTCRIVSEGFTEPFEKLDRLLAHAPA